MKLVDGGMGDLFGDEQFPEPKARATDPITSHQAAADAKINVKASRKLVLLAHASHPDGLTDYELADLVGLQQNSAGKRRGDLCKVGLVGQTEERRPAPSGSACIVWRVTADGLSMARVLKL